MCPVCLITSGLYVAGGMSTGAITTFLASRLLRDQAEPAASVTATRTEGDDHAATNDRIEK